MIPTMIYVVQRWCALANDGLWTNVMRIDGMPLMFTSQGRAWQAMLALQIEQKGTRFRLIKVQETQ